MPVGFADWHFFMGVGSVLLITFEAKATLKSIWTKPPESLIRNNTLHQVKANDNPSYSKRTRLLSLHAPILGSLQDGYGYAAASGCCFA
jgi:hypothetical protein